MYSPKSNVVENLLYDMKTQPIYRIGEPILKCYFNNSLNNELFSISDETDDGSQFKLKTFFDNGVSALMKPKRTAREQQAMPNQLYFVEYERHTSEIAAFHLDRFVVGHSFTNSSFSLVEIQKYSRLSSSFANYWPEC